MNLGAVVTTTNAGSGVCICDSLRAVLADRERELLEVKGACNNKGCRLHFAHSGPCWVEP